MAVIPTDQILSREIQENVRKWSKDTQDNRKLVKSALFCVLTIDSEWMLKGYINSSSEQYFDNEHEAVDYIDRWHKTHKGYAKFLTPKN